MANTYPWPANGNVGIGTANPIATLDVRGFNMLTDAQGEYNSHFPYDDNNVYVTGQKIILRGGAPQGWKTALTVDGASGNVGIGTEIPRERLHIVSRTLIAGEGVLAVANPDREGDPVAISGVVGSDKIPALPNPLPPPPHVGPVAILGWVDTDDQPQSSIGVRGVNAGGTGVRGESKRGIGVHGISLDGFAGRFDGQVEISGELRVAGAIFCGGIPMNVPDHVFEPDYPLPSLDEVRAYLAEEKHLPNVPSAKTIQQEGLNMSEFQMKLLEKIEELTLYTLAQDEQLKAHQAKIELLQQSLASVG